MKLINNQVKLFTPLILQLLYIYLSIHSYFLRDKHLAKWFQNTNGIEIHKTNPTEDSGGKCELLQSFTSDENKKIFSFNADLSIEFHSNEINYETTPHFSRSDSSSSCKELSCSFSRSSFCFSSSSTA